MVSILKVTTRLKYAVILSIISWPLFLWLGKDVVGSFCALSAFIVGYLFAPITHRQTKKYQVQLLGVGMGFLALYLSSFLRGITELILGEPFRGVGYYFLSALSGPYFGLMFLGIPVVIFSFTNYLIWLWLAKR
jgi:hypothetical protein